MPPTYRQRLRLEGAWLAAVGVAGSAALLAAAEQAKRQPLNTVGQLVVAAGLIAWLGPRSTRRALDDAIELREDSAGSGEPTPLWMHPLIVAGLCAVVVVPREIGIDAAGWDAALRVTGGSALVGIGQAVLLERIVAKREEKEGCRYFRIVGSKGMKTRLGFIPSPVTRHPSQAS